MKTKKVDTEKLKKHKLILIGNEHHNPLGLVRTVGEFGLPIVAIIIRSENRITSKSRYISKLHFVKDLSEGLQLLLNEYGNEENLPFVFTCDDASTDYLNENFAAIKDYFYFFNSSEAGLVNRYMNKCLQVELAKSVGMNVLWTKEIYKNEIPKDIAYPIITKAVDSREREWKKISNICHTEEDLKEVCRKINTDKILIQQFVQKKNELGIDGYSIADGESVFYGMAYNYKYVRDGTYSHYINIFTPHNQQVLKMLATYLHKLKYNGLFDAEFLEGQDGTLYFCEINLRNSGWGYASTKAGMPLPILWAIDTLDGKVNMDYRFEIDEGFTAMEGANYLKYKLKEKNKIKGLAQYLAEFAKTDCHFIYNIRDMTPFWSYIFSYIKRTVKKL